MNEKVKKVFELLGVEPNERFKIEDKRFKVLGIEEHTYCINEQLYIEEDNGILCSDKSLCNLLNGAYTIIKLPKEPKKKKLRDLTGEEWDRWLKKNCGNCNCDKCVFDRASCEASYSDRSWVNNKDIYSEKFLNQEVEVE